MIYCNKLKLYLNEINILKIYERLHKTYCTVRSVDILANERSIPVSNPTLKFPFERDTSWIIKKSVSDITLKFAIDGA